MTSPDVESAASEFLPAGTILSAGFFARPSAEVAPDLIGKVLWRRGFGGGRLTEVEAYLPEGDAASHSARGRTQRNSAMFGPPGSIYVFLSYGVHSLMNLVCDKESVGSAVLIRSFAPLECESRSELWPGARGPGRVGQLLGVQRDMSGLALGDESGVFLVDDGGRPEVGRSQRIGISRGTQLPLRYYMRGSGYVSGPVRPIEGERR